MPLAKSIFSTKMRDALSRIEILQKNEGCPKQNLYSQQKMRDALSKINTFNRNEGCP